MLLSTLCAKAQIYDGITQPTKFRLFVPVSVSLNASGEKTSVSPFFAYKKDVCGWFSVTPLLQYNINSETFIPQVWLNFNVKQKFYILSRSIYDTREREYRHTLSATYKTSHGFMADMTWENMYDGEKFCDTDRMQLLVGYGQDRIVANIGYSFRNKPGMITNIRFKVTEYNWLQMKYDGGTESVQIGCMLQFNGR